MRWWKPLVTRIVLALTTVALGGFISATLARYAPGFGVDERLLDARLNHESIEVLRQEHADERAIGPYYAGALIRMMRGDLGTSKTLQRPVKQLLAERGMVTTQLLVTGLVSAWAVALTLLFVTWLAGRPGLDVAAVAGSSAFLCLPAGAVALLLVLANGPTFLAITLVVFPKIYRYLRNLVRATERMPHVVSARAQGAAELRILLWQVVPVIRCELLALAGVSVGVAVGVVIPVEALCGTAGIGQLAWQAALGRDLPVLIAVSVLVIGCTVLANSGADLLSEPPRCGV